jgi:hypothetical protein
MLVAAALGTWLAWTAVRPALGHAAGGTVDLPALADFIGRNPPPPGDLAAKGFSYVALAWLLAVAGLLPHIAAGVTILFVAILAMLQLGSAAPAFGWVDVVIAAIAGILVARWMPRR